MAEILGAKQYPEVLYTEEEVNQLVNEQRSQVTKEVKEVMMQKTDTVIIKQDCPPTKVVKGIKSHVAFGLGRTNVAPNQEMNVLAIADYMKQFPESKATVTGFADNGTGSRDINLRLAKQRAEAVAKQLIEKYGISRDRLTVSSMQDKEQPFQNKRLEPCCHYHRRLTNIFSSEAIIHLNDYLQAASKGVVNIPIFTTPSHMTTPNTYSHHKSPLKESR